MLKNISFLNQKGERIFLSDIAQFEDGMMYGDIYTDERTKTFHIYGEL